jgi:hypothetical protein
MTCRLLSKHSHPSSWLPCRCPISAWIFAQVHGFAHANIGNCGCHYHCNYDCGCTDCRHADLLSRGLTSPATSGAAASFTFTTKASTVTLRDQPVRNKQQQPQPQVQHTTDVTWQSTTAHLGTVGATLS